jgi:hypothetical protein
MDIMYKIGYDSAFAMLLLDEEETLASKINDVIKTGEVFCDSCIDIC